MLTPTYQKCIGGKPAIIGENRGGSWLAKNDHLTDGGHRVDRLSAKPDRLRDTRYRLGMEKSNFDASSSNHANHQIWGVHWI
jgi:hypothetical protein